MYNMNRSFSSRAAFLAALESVPVLGVGGYGEEDDFAGEGVGAFDAYTGVGADMEMTGADDALELLGVGGSDIVGGADIVGALARAMVPAMQRQYGSQAVTQNAFPASSQGQQFYANAHQAHLAKQDQLAKAQFLPTVYLGVDSRPQTGAADILAGATLAIPASAAVPTRVTSFLCSAAIAPFFNINSMTIARLNLLAGSSGIPAEMFIPNARHPPMESAILPAGSSIVTNVENVDAAAHRFRAGYTVIDLTPAAARIV